MANLNHSDVEDEIRPDTIVHFQPGTIVHFDMPTVKKSAERLAAALDEVMGFGVALAINLAEDQRSRNAADSCVLVLKAMRLLSADMIERTTGLDAARQIHVPEMPPVGTLYFEQPGPKPAA